MPATTRLPFKEGATARVFTQFNSAITTPPSFYLLRRWDGGSSWGDNASVPAGALVLITLLGNRRTGMKCVAVLLLRKSCTKNVSNNGTLVRVQARHCTAN
jgi:hypothetical protein